MNGTENTTATNAAENQEVENTAGAEVAAQENATAEAQQGSQPAEEESQSAQESAGQPQNAAGASQGLDEFLNSNKAFKAEFDRRVAKAIDTYKQNHSGTQQKPGVDEVAVGSSSEQKSENIKPEQEATGNDNPDPETAAPEKPNDIGALIAAEVEKATNKIKFETCLQRTMEKAGIKDTIGYLAHIDVEDLRAHYDAKKDTIDGYETVEEEMRKSYPHYFATGTATGAAHGTFEKESNAPLSLKEALTAALNGKN